MSSLSSRLLLGQHRVEGTDQQSRIAGAALFTADRRKPSLWKYRNIFRKSHRFEFERAAQVPPDDNTVPQEENWPDSDEVYQPFWPQYSGYATFTAGSEQLGCAIDFFPLHVREKERLLTKLDSDSWSGYFSPLWIKTLGNMQWTPHLTWIDYCQSGLGKGVFSSKSLSYQSFWAFSFAYSLLLVKDKQNNIEVQNA